jgi:hypothetical protein
LNFKGYKTITSVIMRTSSSTLFPLLVCCIGLLFLSSCGDIQQEYYINSDGSGKMEASFDLGEMMSMMKGFDGMGMPDDTLSDDDIPEDTSSVDETAPPKDPMQIIMERVTDPNYSLEFDTLMQLDQIMPDSVKATVKRMDLVKKMALHMKSPANSADLTLGIVMNYDNVTQLQDMINHLDSIGGSESILPGGMNSGMGQGTFTRYDANLKDGWIKFDSTDYSSFNQEMGMMGDSTAGSEDMGMMEMMFGSSKIRTIVHVPGEVISCTNKDAVITKDERVIIEHDFMDVIKKGKVPGFTIKFKPNK